MTEYDSEYKLTFSSSWLVQQLVEAFLDASVTDIMDLGSLTMFPTESISKNPKSKKFKIRRNDVMWKIPILWERSHKIGYGNLMIMGT